MKRELEVSELEAPAPSKKPRKADPDNSLALPIDLIDIIAGYSTPLMEELNSVAGSSFHCRYQPELDKRAAKQLMAYVLNPTAENIVKAKAMYAANPRIMFIETEGYELASGIEGYVDEKTGEPCTRLVYRKVIGSAFQAVLGTGDSELYYDMATHFDKIVYKSESGEIETGAQRALKQIQARFPNGFDYPPTDDTFNTLIADIAEAITNDQTLITTDRPNEATRAALTRLRQYLLPKDVTQGHHFNLSQLIKACEIYNQNWNPWNENQRPLFWRQVIGYLQRLAPVVDAQAFCTGLYYLQEENEPLSRPAELTIHNDSKSSDEKYYLSNASLAGLGFDFGIYMDGPRGAGEGHWRAGWLAARGGRARVEKLCRAKTSDLGHFHRQLAERANPTTTEPPQTVRNSLMKRK